MECYKKRSSGQQGDAVAGCAQQSGVGVQDHVYRDHTQHAAETTLGMERVEKASASQSGKDARRNTPAQVDPAGRHHFDG